MKVEDLLEAIDDLATQKDVSNFLSASGARVIIYATPGMMTPAGRSYVTVALLGQKYNDSVAISTATGLYNVYLRDSMGASVTCILAEPIDATTETGAKVRIADGTRMWIRGKIKKIISVDKDKLLKYLLHAVKYDHRSKSDMINVIRALEKLGLKYPEFKSILKSLSNQ